VLTPLAVDASHPFPQLQNKSHNLFLRLKRPERPTEALHAVVAIPARPAPARAHPPIPRPMNGTTSSFRILIQNHIHYLFPGLTVEAGLRFPHSRATATSTSDEEEAENLLRTIEDELRKRARGNAVRLENRTRLPARHAPRPARYFQNSPRTTFISSMARSIPPPDAAGLDRRAGLVARQALRPDHFVRPPRRLQLL